MMRLLASLFIKLLILTSIVQGQQLFAFQDAFVWVDGVQKDRLSTNSLDQTVKNTLTRLTDTGYFDASIDSLTERGVFIHSGPRYTLKSFVLFIHESDTIQFAAYVPFTSDYVDIWIGEQLSEYRYIGFPFAAITLKETILDTDAHQVSVVMDLNPGEHVIVDALRFQGNRQLSQSFLSRQAGFASEKDFSPDDVQIYENRLQLSPFLNSVNYIGITRAQEGWELVYEIEEIRSSSIDLIAGYNPTPGASTAFVGRGDLRLENLIREGSSAHFYFERLPSDRSRLELGYTQHWIVGLPLQLHVETQFYQQDSTYMSRGIATETTYQLANRYEVGLHYSGNVIRNNQLPGVSRYQQGRRQSFGLHLGYTSLDRRHNPTSGIQVRMKTHTGRRTLPADAPSVYNRTYPLNGIEITARSYHSLTPRWVLTPRVNASLIESDVYFDDSLIRFGGALSLRGYREEQFQANRVVWGDVETRYLLDRFSYLFLFAGSGYLTTPDAPGVPGSPLVDQTLRSAGFGLSYRIPLGMLQFSYALSGNNSFSNGMVHFGIVNSF